MREIFCERTVTYNLRNNNEFLLPMVRTTTENLIDFINGE